jgi:hypothetical protein
MFEVISMEQYYGYIDFYHAYEAERKRLITIEDIDHIIAKLKDEGCKIREYRDGRITVRSPEEIKASETKRKAIQALSASRFTKLGAAFPKDVVSQFAEACCKLGYKQTDILMPVIKKTIKEAELI